MKKQYRSALMASIHEPAEGLHAAGVMDKRTMREFDELCLTPVRPLKAKEIRALRLREGATRKELRLKCFLWLAKMAFRLSHTRNRPGGLFYSAMPRTIFQSS